MTRYDQQILLTALAFITVLLKEDEKLKKDSAQKIIKLAGMLSEFCNENIAAPVTGTDAIDIESNTFEVLS